MVKSTICNQYEYLRHTVNMEWGIKENHIAMVCYLGSTRKMVIDKSSLQMKTFLL